MCYDVPRLRDYFWVFQNRDTPSGDGNGFQFSISSNSRGIGVFSGSTNRHSLSSFEHVVDLNKKTMAFTIDNNNFTFSDNCKFYNEPTKEGIINSVLERNTYSIGSAYPWQGDTTYSFEGNIYSIRVYNRKLSEDELINNYEVDRLRFDMD